MRPAAGRLQHRRGPGHVVVREVAVPAVDRQQFVGRLATLIEHHRHRQRLLALPQVVADRLAADRRVAPDAQHVVDRLEGAAQLHPELLEGVHLVGRRPGQHRTHRGGVGQQRTRLVRLHRDALGQRHRRQVVERHVGRLPGDHRRRGPGQAGGRLPVLGRRVVEQHPVRQVVEGVARDDRLVGAERRPHRRPVSPLGVAVDDVVVDQ